jgi:hypothetical protein
MGALRPGAAGLVSVDVGLDGIKRSKGTLAHYKNAWKLQCPEGFAIVIGEIPARTDCRSCTLAFIEFVCFWQRCQTGEFKKSFAGQQSC